MTMRDLATEFSSNQDIKGDGSTVVSTNALDTRAPTGDVAVGTDTQISFLMEADFVGGTSVEFRVYTSDSENFSTDPETMVATTGALPVANLKKGFVANVKMPYGCRRYLRCKYVNVGKTTTANVTAGVVRGVDNWKPANPVAWKY